MIHTHPIGKLFYICFVIWRVAQAKASFIPLSAPLTWLPIQIQIGLHAVIPGNWSLATVFFLVIRLFPGKPRSKTQFPALLPRQNIAPLVVQFVNFCGFRTLRMICVYQFPHQYHFGVIIKPLYILSLILYFMSQPNTWRLIATWFVTNTRKISFSLNTSLHRTSWRIFLPEPWAFTVSDIVIQVGPLWLPFMPNLKGDVWIFVN